jgi:hypothetical protein
LHCFDGFGRKIETVSPHALGSPGQ